MKVSALVSCLALGILFTACGERAANVTSPNTHRSAGLGFDFPGNWKITENAAAGDFQYIFVETPGDALVILQSYALVDALPLSDFADEFAREAAGATPIGTVTTNSMTPLPTAHGFEWVEEDFQIDILGETVPHYRIYGARTIRDRRVFLIFQVATEDRAKAEPGFELIRDTLKDPAATAGP